MVKQSTFTPEVDDRREALPEQSDTGNAQTALTSDFNTFYHESSLLGIRKGLYSGLGLFLIFGFVDTHVAQVLFRFGVICPSILITLYISYHKLFKKHFQTIMAVAYLLVSVSLIFMMNWTKPGDANRYIYSVGLILCIMGCNTVRLRKKPALLISILIVTVFIVMVYERHEDQYLNIPILISSVILTYYTTSSTEQILKENYHLLNIVDSERKTLVITKERLESLDVFKSKLLSIIAHDLKAPNNNLSAILDLLKNNNLTQEEFNYYVKEISAQLRSNQFLFENLLRWSVAKFDNKTNLVKVNLFHLVSECQALLKPLADEKHNTIYNNVDQLYLQTDPELMKIAIRNIIANSIKYTEGGSITCYIERDHFKLYLCIADTGIGMDAEQLDNLLDWKKRKSTLGTKSEKGTGIGLLIANDFLTTINSSLKIVSYPGKGTTTRIELNKVIYY